MRGVSKYDWPTIDRQRMAHAARRSQEYGLSDSERGSGDRAGNRGAPAGIPYGITSSELADYVREFAEFQASRVMSDGTRQYDRGTHQAFEDMSVNELVTGAVEELADLAVYASMISLQLQRLAKSLQDKDTGDGSNLGYSRPANPFL
jgi:hypothetical protein